MCHSKTYIGKYLKYVGVLFICVQVFTIVLAQERSFFHLKREDGLSRNSILSIAQDKEGFMWFGTSAGLNRYDGYHIKVFKHLANDEKSLANDYIYDLLCDDKGVLWIGTGTAGLARYDKEKDCFAKIELPYGAKAVYNICEDSTRRLWMGTDQGLFVLRDNKMLHAWTTHNGLLSNIIQAVFADNKGNVWVGTNLGLLQMRLSDNHLDQSHFVPILSGFITSINIDAGGNILFGTPDRGMGIYNPVRKSIQYVTKNTNELISNDIRKILPDNKGNIWIGTQQGISVYNPGSRSFSNYTHQPMVRNSLSQNSVYSMFMDANKSIWVGTYYGGVNVSYPYATNFKIWQSTTAMNNGGAEAISAVIGNDIGGLWVGTEGGGLNYWNAQSEMMVHVATPRNLGGLELTMVKSLLEDGEGHLWIGTKGAGLIQYNKENHSFKKIALGENPALSLKMEVLALLLDHHNRLWVGTNQGLFIYQYHDRQLVRIKPDFSIPEIVYTVFEDSRGAIWIGTEHSLYSLEGNYFQRFHGNFSINCITEARDGTLWLGDHDNGLLHYRPGALKMGRYGEKNGLASNNVLGILEDDRSNIWASTDNGLSKFAPSRNLFVNYGTSDGLPGNEFDRASCWKGKDGRFFFGSLNGLVSFYPDQIQQNDGSAPLVFTGARLFNKEVAVGDGSKILPKNIGSLSEIRLRHDQNVFTLDFALLNYIKSHKNKYLYKLQGFDRNWTETFQPSVTYTNLSSGEYVFKVRGANNDGVWSHTAALKIKVLPPFWLTWWAFLIYFLLLGGAMFLFLRYLFLQALMRKEEQLYKSKLAFFTNVSHEIRTHLTLITTPLEQLKDDGKELPQLEYIKKNGEKLLNLVNELMDFSRSETDNLTLKVGRYDIAGCLRDVCEPFQALATTQHIHLSLDLPKSPVWVYVDKNQMEKVFTNLLMNAFKFTHTEGSISVQVEPRDSNISVRIIDNGVGIESEYLPKIFANFFQVEEYAHKNTGYGIGLALSKSIVRLHHGSISVESRKESETTKGQTVFTIELLRGKTHFDSSVVFLDTIYGDVPAALSEQDLLPSVSSFPARASSGRPTILIVEDNAEIRALLCDDLQELYNIEMAADGIIGWEHATANVPDVIISDVMMPRMDGFELCHKLKTDQRTSHIPIVLLTAKDQLSDQVEGLETGADVYLTKPFHLRVLGLNIRNLLQSREAIRQQFFQSLSAGTLPLVSEQQPLPAQEKPSTFTSETPAFVNKVDREFYEHLEKTILENIEEPEFNIGALCRKIAMSESVLYKKVKAVTGMTIVALVKNIRMQKAASMLTNKQFSISEISMAVGYSDRKYFSKEFKKHFGVAPTQYAADDSI